MRQLFFAFILAALPQTAAAMGGTCAETLGYSLAMSDRETVRENGLAYDQMRLRHEGGTAWVIENAFGTLAATDLTARTGDGVVPDILTLNPVLSADAALMVDPGIAHVLKAGAKGEAVHHFLETGLIGVRYNSTPVTADEGRANAVVVLEVAGLCIGQIALLEREFSDLDRIVTGQLDVVLVPVAGAGPPDNAAILRMAQGLDARLVLPMGWRDRAALDAFLAAAGEGFDIDRRFDNSVILSRAALPARPTVMVLEPEILQGMLE